MKGLVTSVLTFCRINSRLWFSEEDLEAFIGDSGIVETVDGIKGCNQFVHDLFDSSESKEEKETSWSSWIQSNFIGSLWKAPVSPEVIIEPDKYLLFEPFVQEVAEQVYQAVLVDLHDDVQKVFSLTALNTLIRKILPDLPSDDEDRAVKIIVAQLRKMKLAVPFEASNSSECVKILNYGDTLVVSDTDKRIGLIRCTMDVLENQIEEFTERRLRLARTFIQRFKGKEVMEHYKPLLSRILHVIQNKRSQLHALEAYLLHLSMAMTNQTVLSASRSARSCFRGLVNDNDIYQVDEIAEGMDIHHEFDQVLSRGMFNSSCLSFDDLDFNRLRKRKVDTDDQIEKNKKVKVKIEETQNVNNSVIESKCSKLSIPL